MAALTPSIDVAAASASSLSMASLAASSLNVRAFSRQPRTTGSCSSSASSWPAMGLLPCQGREDRLEIGLGDLREPQELIVRELAHPRPLRSELLGHDLL